MIRKFCVLFLGLLLGVSGANAFCFRDAAQTHKVNEQVLRAIAQHESRMRSDTEVLNTNGTTDIGLTGINSVHLPMLEKVGVSRQMLLDPCVNLYVAAWFLSQKIQRHGNTWVAVGAYHSETAAYNVAYQKKIIALLEKDLQK